MNICLFLLILFMFCPLIVLLLYGHELFCIFKLNSNENKNILAYIILNICELSFERNDLQLLIVHSDIKDDAHIFGLNLGV